MLYDPQLESRLEEKNNLKGAKLTPTLGYVKEEVERLSGEQDEFKKLLQQLAKSDFVSEMKKLQTSVIE